MVLFVAYSKDFSRLPTSTHATRRPTSPQHRCSPSAPLRPRVCRLCSAPSEQRARLLYPPTLSATFCHYRASGRASVAHLATSRHRGYFACKLQGRPTSSRHGRHLKVERAARRLHRVAIWTLAPPCCLPLLYHRCAALSANWDQPAGGCCSCCSRKRRPSVVIETTYSSPTNAIST